MTSETLAIDPTHPLNVISQQACQKINFSQHRENAINKERKNKN